MSFPEKDSVALVTGASGGIGAAVARHLAEAGCHVILTGRQPASLLALAASLGIARTTVVPADLTDEGDRQSLARHCADRMDVLVHCAGLFLPGPADAGQNATLLEAINVTAPMALSSLCLAAVLKARGQIVFVNSTAALNPAGHAHGAYTASKRALKIAADGLRPTLRGRHVRVLNVFPGRTDTAMQQTVLDSEARTGSRIALLQPDDIARTILYCLGTPRRFELTDIVIRPENA
ncbi:SDR family NAD(P)-dependent oxidoreductase [Acetobacter sp. TBRC 12305]|uniref:SDR family NAD(P)-dependent oxidoreductase n=1 Tax=Acetobacter garciniae TaxID=2817435 RepID=A0A939HPP0_9PROT|nr:SDR family NAD(P)-dependent oxidoreductase [Acetobacter garciniae]MBO1325507.1 SDR family NAD(P)-dependent oxidoreductase [Acetobacter garciniae]MBX0345321.1 SDR family NAD(P)-dependent oxidoreductase [Acetobacter garciniae]